MHTKIFSDFWSDPEIEKQPSDVKLTALWLMTNERVNLLGYAEVTEKRFVYDTGLPGKALPKTLEALGKVFQRFGEGYWIRNYIRLQIGDGDALERNNMFKPLARAWQGLRDAPLKQAIVSQYPQFANAARVGGLGASPEAQEQSRAEQHRGEQSSVDDRGVGKEGAIPREIAAVAAFFAAQGSTADEAANFFNHYAATGWKTGANVPIKDWRAQAKKWIRRGGPAKNQTKGAAVEPPFNAALPHAHTGGVEVR